MFCFERFFLQWDGFKLRWVADHFKDSQRSTGQLIQGLYYMHPTPFYWFKTQSPWRVTQKSRNFTTVILPCLLCVCVTCRTHTKKVVVPADFLPSAQVIRSGSFGAISRIPKMYCEGVKYAGKVLKRTSTCTRKVTCVDLYKLGVTANQLIPHHAMPHIPYTQSAKSAL